MRFYDEKTKERLDMSFVERVKEILLSRNEEEIENIKLKIEELQGTHSQKRENVSRLKEESEIASKEKAAVQKNVLTKKELSELEIIYNFIYLFHKSPNHSKFFIKNDISLYHIKYFLLL